MTKYFFVAFIGSLMFAGIDCKHNPVGPSPGADTTSSNFTWTVDTIGASGSYLYDVSIVNDSLAYAVGLLMPSDSLGRNNTIYWDNAAIWNGATWTPLQIPFYYQGQKTFTTLYAVFAFGPNDILFSGGGDIEHWNGATFSTDYSVNSLINGQINKMWGQSSTNFYVVGNAGTMVHYVNGSWTKIQTGTTLPFQDIWGDGGQVLAVASDKFGFGGQYLVQVNGNVAVHLTDTVSAYESLSGIWFERNREYIVVGSGIYEKDSLPGSKSWNGPFVPLNWYSYAVRGQAANDVMVAGESASLSHFNGSSWRGFTNFVDPSVRLQSVAIKGIIAMAVGFIHDEARGIYYGVVYTGRR